MNSKSNKNFSNQTVWLVWPTEEAGHTPTACFSDYAHAKMLSNYLHSHDEPAAVHPSETDLEVDKYLPVLAEMKFPFEVSMFRDGTLFEALSAGLIVDPSVSLDLHFDPVTTQMIPGAPIGISGVFWAFDTDAAVQLADEFRLHQIEAGNL